MKKHLNKISTVLAVSALLGCASIASAAPFGSGNIVVLRVGDGTSLLVNQTAAPLFLDEYLPDGTLVQSISMPTTTSGSNRRVTLHGVETAVGALNRSVNNQYLTFGGYDAAVGTASLTSSTVDRVIARVDSDGNVNTTTTISDGFGRIASVISDDGLHFWSTGNTSGARNGGLRYSSLLGNSTTTLVVSSPNNLLMTGIFDDQLYTSVSFGSTIGVATLGTGLPVSTGQSMTLLPGFFTSGTHAPRAYYFLDASTIFLVDTQSQANQGGLQKWTFNGSTWDFATTPFPIISPTTSAGLGGLVGTSSGSNVTLYATTVENETTGNSLIKLESTDGGATFPTITVLASSPAGTFNTLFRGVAFAPEPAGAGVEMWEEFDGPLAR